MTATEVDEVPGPPEIPEYVLAPCDMLWMGMTQKRWSTGHVLSVTGWSRRELAGFLRNEVRMTGLIASRLARLTGDGPEDWWAIEDTYLAWGYAGVPRRPVPVSLPAWVARAAEVTMPANEAPQPAHRGS